MPLLRQADLFGQWDIHDEHDDGLHFDSVISFPAPGGTRHQTKLLFSIYVQLSTVLWPNSSLIPSFFSAVLLACVCVCVSVDGNNKWRADFLPSQPRPRRNAPNPLSPRSWCLFFFFQTVVNLTIFPSTAVSTFFRKSFVFHSFIL